MENTKQQRTILVVTLVTAFITTFMGSALNLSIPNMEEEFGVSATLIGWVITIYTLSVTAFSVPFGKIADTFGRRKILLTGLLVFIVTSIACSFATNIWVMLVFRALQGLGSAMIFATGNAILLSTFPESKRGHVLGLSTASVYVGLSLGPVAGGFLNENFSWNAIFFAAAFIAVVAMAMSIPAIPKSQTVTKAKLDLGGNILYIAAIVVTLYGLTNLTAMKYAWMILLGGILLGVGFVLIERKASNPVIRVTMFSEDSAFTLSNIAALLNYGATFTISYLMSIYLQLIMGFSSQTAGFILIAQPVMQALFSPMMGKLSDKVQPYKLASMGMVICSAGLFMFSFVSETTALWYIIFTLMMCGFGFAMFGSPNTNAIMSCVDKKDYGVGNSILTTMRTFGQSSSMAIVTIVVGLVLGDVALTESQPAQLIETMHILFIVFTVLCIIGTVMSLKRRSASK